MADGQPGELGAVVVEPVEAEHKHACVLAAIPHQPAVVPFVKDLVLKLNLAIKMAFSFPEPSFLLVTWSAKRRALVAATTGCREISDIR